MKEDSKFWTHKLWEFLHDPPSKALDLSGHRDVARSCRQTAGLHQEPESAPGPQTDWQAASADRFPFPTSRQVCSLIEPGGRIRFKHPLGGTELDFSGSEGFATSAEAEELFARTQGAVDVDDIPIEQQAWARFFLHWRRWPVESAQLRSVSYYLPADTRIPDHNIWCHNSMTAAFAGIESLGQRPALLMFQLGPVQDFIAQARSTRDLWSGSYLLSWLMAHALKAVSDRLGPDSIIFPSLRGQPLFDVMQQSLYDQIKFSNGRGGEDTLRERMKNHPREYLTPTLPNRFMALVPATQGAEAGAEAKQAVQNELIAIGKSCRKWLAEQGYAIEESYVERYEAQLQKFTSIQWHVEPWEEGTVADLVEKYEGLYAEPSPSTVSFAKLWEMAKQMPSEHQPGYHLKNSAFCWPYYYARAMRAFDGRRRLRDFDFWKTDEHLAGATKDTLSGREETIGSETWWRNLHEGRAPSAIRCLFRSQDRLGAINLVKKTWHLAHLKEVWGLNVKRALSFESVPGVAAGIWRRDVLDNMKTHSEACHQMLELIPKVCEHAAAVDLDLTALKSGKHAEQDWIETNDPEVFFARTWALAEGPGPREIVRLLNKRDDAEQRLLLPPPSYYAVLAFDGDEMGKWIAGEKTPLVMDQLSPEAAAYFSKQGMEKVLRPLSPSYHLQFSEALSNFSLYLARPIVELFGGQLIYSGGDDVLAMVPGAQALDCAAALRAAFTGQAFAGSESIYTVQGRAGGFLQLVQPKAEQPRWPLVVPGPRADASVGISIGHIHSPLQNLVRAAQQAEKRAKQHYKRAAFSVSVFKRSGELTTWGGRWDSHALEAYQSLLDLMADPQTSAKLPYAVRSWLAPYGLVDTGLKSVLQDVDHFPFRDAVETELTHVLSRQAGLANSTLKDSFKNAVHTYLKYVLSEAPDCRTDIASMFSVAAFLERGE